jgi:hypothetical protein
LVSRSQNAWPAEHIKMKFATPVLVDTYVCFLFSTKVTPHKQWVFHHVVMIRVVVSKHEHAEKFESTWSCVRHPMKWKPFQISIDAKRKKNLRAKMVHFN